MNINFVSYAIDNMVDFSSSVVVMKGDNKNGCVLFGSNKGDVSRGT